MASKKTAPFTLTERLTLTGGPNPTASATIDLASYIDVADRQGIMIHSVDYVYQGPSAKETAVLSLPALGAVITQVTDLNRGSVVFANDRALVSSAVLQVDNSFNPSMDTDIYPDNYGPSGANEGRIVVNDQLYVESVVDGNLTGELNVTVRVTASVVTLTAKDFMAIAIQSTAADN